MNNQNRKVFINIFAFVAVVLLSLATEYILIYHGAGFNLPVDKVLGPEKRVLISALASGILLFVGVVVLFAFKKIKKIETVAILIIIVFGLFLVFFSPVMNGFDENAHFFKALATLDGKMFDYESYNYEISDSYFVLRDNYLGKWWYTPEFQSGWLNSRTYVEALPNAFAQPTYPFYGYLFCCLGIAIGRILHLSTGLIYELGRVFNLFGYAALVFAAFKILPEKARGFKAVMLIYACMPGTLFVASHYSQDGIVYAVTGILIALFLKMYFAEKILKRDFLLFAILFLLLVPLKYPYICLGFLLLLLPKNKFGFRKPYLWIVSVAVLSLVIAGVWLIFVSSGFTETRIENVNGFEQMKFLLSHIPTFLRTAIFTIVHTLPSYFGNTMRIAGGYDVYISLAGGMIFSIISLIIAFLYTGKLEIGRIVKIILIPIILLIVLGNIVALYASYNTVGESYYIQGVQGRYFYQLFLLVPMVMANKMRFGKVNADENDYTLAVSFILVWLIWFCFGFIVFYV